jgi:putative PIN family toxin of toxin-antitoxin system
MKEKRAVIDTNVVVAGLRSRQGASFLILQGMLSGDVIPVLTVPLVLEYEDALTGLRQKLRLSKKEIGELLDFVCSVEERHEVYYLWRPWLKDPRDEMVLEAAVVSEVNVVVTHNIADFGGAQDLGVVTMVPGEYVRKRRLVK